MLVFIGLYALMLEKTQLTHTVFPLCLKKRSVWAPDSLRLLKTQSALIGRLTRAWPNAANNNRTAAPNQV